MVERLCHLIPIQQGEPGLGDPIFKVKGMIFKGSATWTKPMTKHNTAKRGEGQDRCLCWRYSRCTWVSEKGKSNDMLPSIN